MKQVSEQMLKYNSSFATSFIQNEIRTMVTEGILPLLSDSKAFISFELAA